MLYFITDGTAVKIGYTQDRARLAVRLSTLACGNPRALEVLAIVDGGGPRSERVLHELLSPWRIRGEWFKRKGPVLRTIERAQTGESAADLIRSCARTVAASENFRSKVHGSRAGTERHGKLSRAVAAGIDPAKARRAV